VEQQIEVRGETFEISTHSAETTATVSKQELDTLAAGTTEVHGRSPPRLGWFARLERKQKKGTEF